MSLSSLFSWSSQCYFLCHAEAGGAEREGRARGTQWFPTIHKTWPAYVGYAPYFLIECPQMFYFPIGCLISKAKCRQLLCPCKSSASAETWYLVSQAPNTKPTLGVLTPGMIDSVTSANQVFSNFLFLVLYSLSYKSFLPSAPCCSSPSRDCLLQFHELLNKVCVTSTVLVKLFFFSIAKTHF